MDELKIVMLYVYVIFLWTLLKYNVSLSIFIILSIPWVISFGLFSGYRVEFEE